MVRLLHTADWHLGQTLLGQSRYEEQALALDWLHDTIVTERADLLVVAGDIFDVASPSEEARRQYFDFLDRLVDTPLSWVVIIAGNHDSPRMLAGVHKLARRHQIYVVADPAAPECCGDDVLDLHDPSSGTLRCRVAAVPFLHDRLVRRSRPGQSADERAEALATGIHAHYARLAGAAAGRESPAPLVATGHLYATGAQAREGQDNIYVGNQRNLRAADLPDAFDYVALGHIHRPQALPGAEHVRYSGSLIPLDFQESEDTKGAYCADLAAGAPPEVRWLPSPVSRRLKRIAGSADELPDLIETFVRRHAEDALAPWLDVALTEGYADERFRKTVRALAEAHGARILKVTHERRHLAGESAPTPRAYERLADLSVGEVFARRCASDQLGEDLTRRLAPLFDAVHADARVGR